MYIRIFSRHFIFTDLINSKAIHVFYFHCVGEGFQLGNAFEFVCIIIEVFFIFAPLYLPQK